MRGIVDVAACLGAALCLLAGLLVLSADRPESSEEALAQHLLGAGLVAAGLAAAGSTPTQVVLQDVGVLDSLLLTTVQSAFVVVAGWAIAFMAAVVRVESSHQRRLTRAYVTALAVVFPAMVALPLLGRDARWAATAEQSTAIVVAIWAIAGVVALLLRWRSVPRARIEAISLALAWGASITGLVGVLADAVTIAIPADGHGLVEEVGGLASSLAVALFSIGMPVSRWIQAGSWCRSLYRKACTLHDLAPASELVAPVVAAHGRDALRPGISAGLALRLDQAILRRVIEIRDAQRALSDFGLSKPPAAEQCQVGEQADAEAIALIHAVARFRSGHSPTPRPLRVSRRSDRMAPIAVGHHPDEIAQLVQLGRAIRRVRVGHC